MWFKNIYLYRFIEPFTLSGTKLQELLLKNEARAIGKLERATFGWTAPLPSYPDMLVHEQGNCLLIAAKKQEKLLPVTVVREQVAEKVAKIEAEEGRKVGGREKRNLFDDVMQSLLPIAFTRQKVTYAYIDREQGWLLINTSTPARADELTTLLRDCLGSLKIEAPLAELSISAVMTDWVKNNTSPSRLTLEDYCEMHDPDAVQTMIKCVNQDLATEEVQAHFRSGKVITRLELTWADRVNFILDHAGLLKRIRFLDLIVDEQQSMENETVEEQFVADFSIMHAEFRNLLGDMFAWLGMVVEEGVVAV